MFKPHSSYQWWSLIKSTYYSGFMIAAETPGDKVQSPWNKTLNMKSNLGFAPALFVCVPPGRQMADWSGELATEFQTHHLFMKAAQVTPKQVEHLEARHLYGAQWTVLLSTVTHLTYDQDKPQGASQSSSALNDPTLPSITQTMRTGSTSTTGSMPTQRHWSW